MKNVAIIGADTHPGLELIRLLLRHPDVELTTITSRKHSKQSLKQVFARFTGCTNLEYSNLNVYKIAKHNEVVLLCLPHKNSMEIAAKFRSYGTKVIDLSADFRFKTIKTYEKIYGKHTQRKLHKEAAYGLCEIFNEDIKPSFLVGVPGCFTTSTVLGLAPLLQNQSIIKQGIICDTKAGMSILSRDENEDQVLSEQFGNFKTYSIPIREERPEMEEKLSMLTGEDIKITFASYLLSVPRGLLSTIYVQPIKKWNNGKLRSLYKRFYKRSPFVQILEGSQTPQLNNVVGTNICQISIRFDEHSEKIVIVSAIDNLMKGAAGQAVQCMNLMCGFSETAGL